MSKKEEKIQKEMWQFRIEIYTKKDSRIVILSNDPLDLVAVAGDILRTLGHFTIDKVLIMP